MFINKFLRTIQLAWDISTFNPNLTYTYTFCYFIIVVNKSTFHNPRHSQWVIYAAQLCPTLNNEWVARRMMAYLKCILIKYISCFQTQQSVKALVTRNKNVNTILVHREPLLLCRDAVGKRIHHCSWVLRCSLNRISFTMHITEHDNTCITHNWMKQHSSSCPGYLNFSLILLWP